MEIKENDFVKYENLKYGKRIDPGNRTNIGKVIRIHADPNRGGPFYVIRINRKRHPGKFACITRSAQCIEFFCEPKVTKSLTLIINKLIEKHGLHTSKKLH